MTAVMLATEAVQPHGGFLAAAGLSALTGVVLVVAAFRASRPRLPAVGPASLDLGEEPPAVVGFLVNRMTVTGESMAATLLDLAARRWLTIEPELGSAVIRTRSTHGEGALLPYERQVLDHVRSLAADNVVPAGAIASGPGDVSRHWRRAYTEAVVADARSRGLCRARWDRGNEIAILVAIGAMGGLLAMAALAGKHPPDDADWSSHPAFVALGAVGLGLVIALNHFVSSDAQRDTPAGLNAASQWLGLRAALAADEDFMSKSASAVAIWDRHLAYAAAMGLAPEAVEDVPLGAQDDTHAWSFVDGRWRPVYVVYPRFRPAWGRSPIVAMGLGLLVALPASALAGRCFDVAQSYLRLLGAEGPVTGANITIGWAALSSILPLTGLAGWWLVAFLRGARDLGSSREVRGVVLRERVIRPRDWLPDRLEDALYPARDDFRSVRHYLAVDTGQRDRLVAWRVEKRIADVARQGDQVVARVTPSLRFVRSITCIRYGEEASPT